MNPILRALRTLHRLIIDLLLRSLTNLGRAGVGFNRLMGRSCARLG